MVGDSANQGRAEAMGDTRHIPVLMTEVLAAFSPAAGKTLMDATLGGGGHTRALLEAGAARVLALDWDAAALARCAHLEQTYGDRLWLSHAPYDQLDVVASAANIPAVDGILMDLGFSSDQLDDPVRGLSYHADGPLDMRLNSRQSLTAAAILNTWREADIADLLFHFGEEPKARPMARAIVKVRKESPFVTTRDLVRLVEDIYPPRRGLQRAHPAARIFQALRVAVNDEMTVLERALGVAAGLLKPGGRLAVITFQPLEERLVKKIFRELCADVLDDVGRVVSRAPFVMGRKQIPTADEVQVNPRARSAILRVLERTRL